MNNIVAWIFGIGAMIALFSIYQQKDRKRLLLCKLCADVCWVVHYICLGAMGGAIPNFVGIFRELVFVNREKRKWASNPLWPVVFILANMTLGIITARSALNILPLTASALVTVSLWLKKPTLTKLLSVPVSCAFLVYDIFVCSWIGVVNESIALSSILLSFIQSKHEKKEQMQNGNS